MAADPALLKRLQSFETTVDTNLQANTAALAVVTTELRYLVKYMEFITGERLLAEDLDDEHRLSIEDLP
jgi:hypothetical protein